jgi:hypothetical protein
MQNLQVKKQGVVTDLDRDHMINHGFIERSTNRLTPEKAYGNTPGRSDKAVLRAVESHNNRRHKHLIRLSIGLDHTSSDQGILGR